MGTETQGMKKAPELMSEGLFFVGFGGSQIAVEPCLDF
jgi:hypothetical protein